VINLFKVSTSHYQVKWREKPNPSVRNPVQKYWRQIQKGLNETHILQKAPKPRKQTSVKPLKSKNHLQTDD
jgi:hypothetical protein